MKNINKYIITRLLEDYDTDGLGYTFAVLGIFYEKEKAEAFAIEEMQKFIENKISEDNDWAIWEKDINSRETSSDPNEHNKIMQRLCNRIGYKNPNYLTWIYVYIDVIEVPADNPVDDTLFNPKKLGYEVRRFFDSLEDDKSKTDYLWQLKQIDRAPRQCHLWQKKDITEADVFGSLADVTTYSQSSHHSRKLVKCIECGQLYLKEYHEEIDWVDSEDPQYYTFVPVMNEREAEIINSVGLWELHTFAPRINRDWPKGEDSKTYWVGRD